jgi:hypothetical protein
MRNQLRRNPTNLMAKKKKAKKAKKKAKKSRR